MTTGTLVDGLAAVFGSSSAPTSSSVIPYGVVSSNKFSPTGYSSISALGADSLWLGLFPKRGEVLNNDFNNAKDWGIYYLINVNDWVNGPGDFAKDQAILLCYGWTVGTRTIQILFNSGAASAQSFSGVYLRIYKAGTSPEWSEWQKIGCPEPIARVLTASDNVNTLRKTASYLVTSNTVANLQGTKPPTVGYALIEVIEYTRDSNALQRWTNLSNATSRIYERWYNNSAWGDWFLIK